MTKYLFLLYIALGIYLLTGTSLCSDRQAPDTPYTTEWQCGEGPDYCISETQAGKKEIGKEKFHIAQVGISNTNAFGYGRTVCPYKLLKFHPTPSVLARTARLRKEMLPEEKEAFISPPILSTRYSSEYYIIQLKRILI